MEKFKKIIHHILFPHIAFMIILLPISVALLIYALVYEDSNSIIAYVSYFLSAYSLTLVLVRTPDIISFFKNIKATNKYINLYLTDRKFQIKLSLYTTLAVNTAYAVFQLGLGFYHASVWFYALAVYYILLALMRFLLLKETLKEKGKKDLFTEHLLYRFCGVLMLLMNSALTTITFFIVWQNRGFAHHAITTIALAAYTFPTFIMAIINMVKYRKDESPIISASVSISLAAATVSILTLESAMLNSFGEESDPIFRQIITACTGGAVCLFVLILAIYMIVHSTKLINTLKIKRGNKNE